MSFIFLRKLAEKIYDELGCYHTELTYQNAFEQELLMNNIPYVREYPVSILYFGTMVGKSFVDFLVQDKYILEFKAVTKILDKKKIVKGNSGKNINKQVQKYMIALNLPHAYVINFGNEDKLEVCKIKSERYGYEN